MLLVQVAVRNSWLSGRIDYLSDATPALSRFHAPPVDMFAVTLRASFATARCRTAAQPSSPIYVRPCSGRCLRHWDKALTVLLRPIRCAGRLATVRLNAHHRTHVRTQYRTHDRVRRWHRRVRAELAHTHLQRCKTSEFGT